MKTLALILLAILTWTTTAYAGLPSPAKTPSASCRPTPLSCFEIENHKIIHYLVHDSDGNFCPKKKVCIPNSVTSIGKRAFAYNRNLATTCLESPKSEILMLLAFPSHTAITYACSQ